MMLFPSKGQRRIQLDFLRATEGEPRTNRQKNSTPHSKYPNGSKATRKKGRNRFKTGRKSGKH